MAPPSGPPDYYLTGSDIVFLRELAIAPFEDEEVSDELDKLFEDVKEIRRDGDSQDG